MENGSKDEVRYVFTEQGMKAYFTACFEYGILKHMQEPEKYEVRFRLYDRDSARKTIWAHLLKLEDEARQTVVEVD